MDLVPYLYWTFCFLFPFVYYYFSLLYCFYSIHTLLDIVFPICIELSVFSYHSPITISLCYCFYRIHQFFGPCILFVLKIGLSVFSYHSSITISAYYCSFSIHKLLDLMFPICIGLSFRNTTRESNGLDPDQGRRSVDLSATVTIVSISF